MLLSHVMVLRHGGFGKTEAYIIFTLLALMNVFTGPSWEGVFWAEIVLLMAEIPANQLIYR